MIKMVTVFFVLTLLVWGFFQIIPYTPKEVVYNWIKKSLVVVGAMVVTSMILFVFVQLF